MKGLQFSFHRFTFKDSFKHTTEIGVQSKNRENLFIIHTYFLFPKELRIMAVSIAFASLEVLLIIYKL